MYAAGGIAICISFNREKKMKMKRKKNIWAIGPFIVWKITCAQHLFLFRSSAAIKPTIGYLVEQGIISEPEKREWKKDIHTYTYTLYQVNEEGRGISECNAVHHYAISYTMKSGWFSMQVKGMKSEIEAEYTIFLWFGLCHNFEGIFTSFFLLHRFSFGYFFIVFRCKRLYLLDTFQYTYRQ